MEEVRVCGQCSVATHGEEYPCPDYNCSLFLCVVCSNSEVHFREDGSCPEWWGEGLTSEEVDRRMKEAAQEIATE